MAATVSSGAITFDADVWGRCEDFLIRERNFANHYVRNSDPVGPDTHAESSERLEAQSLPADNEPSCNPGLRAGVPSFSHISLQNFAIDKIAIGVKAGAQVFVQRDQRADAHEFII
jgi:hypothetical protein